MKALTAAAIAIAAVAVAGCGGGPPSAAHTPLADGAAAASADRAVLWAVGDGATPGPSADRIAALIRHADMDRFLYLGDVYDTGTAEEFRRWYQPRYGRLAHITIPTIGNHEWANRYSGYYPYWKRMGRAQGPWSMTKIAGWEILDLNSQAAHGPHSAQVRWLERALQGPGDCRIAFWHRPRYSAGVVHGVAPDLNPLWNRLAGHARIVLSGHDHDLQRHRPQRGITQYVVGAGGRGRYGLDRGNSTMAWGRDDVDGALRIVLKPGRALLEFRTPGAHVLDRSRATCSPGEAAPAAQ
jgi:calcineurin-like phosphoesterase family protein